MPNFVPKLGATLLMPSGPAGNHLYVVVTDGEPTSEFLLVSVSTIREGRYHDPTCKIETGAQEFITSPSFAHYGTARIERGERLTRLATSGVFIEKEPMPETIVRAIAAGIEQSAHTPNFILKFYRAFVGR